MRRQVNEVNAAKPWGLVPGLLIRFMLTFELFPASLQGCQARSLVFSILRKPQHVQSTLYARGEFVITQYAKSEKLLEIIETWRTCKDARQN